MATTVKSKAPLLVEGASGQFARINEAITRLDAGWCGMSVKSRSTTAPPGSPSDGDAYMMPASPSGAWTGFAQYSITVYAQGWLAPSETPVEGVLVYVQDEDVRLRWDGSAFVEAEASLGSTADGLTASTTQTQGQGALTAVVNRVTTVANANDVRTLPTAFAGRLCVVANDALVNVLQLFPASGDRVDGGAIDASTVVLAAGRKTLVAIDATRWLTIGLI